MPKSIKMKVSGKKLRKFLGENGVRFSEIKEIDSVILQRKKGGFIKFKT